MGLLEQWKAAKTAFANTTDAKKPSKTILGVRQGTGIEDACKKVDKAKTVAEMQEALALLETKSEAYTRIMTKTLSDPKEVKATDKGVYMTALRRLNQQLVDLKSEAKQMAEALKKEGGDKKTKVSSETIQGAVNEKAMEEAKKMIRLAEGAVSDAASLLKGARDSESRVKDVGKKIDEQFKTAQARAKEGDIMQYNVACSVIERFADEAESIAREALATQKRLTEASGSNLLLARGGNHRIQGLGPQENEKLLKTTGPLFRKQAQDVLSAASVLHGVKATVDEYRTKYSQALNLMGNARDPGPVLRDLAQILEQVSEKQRVELDRNTQGFIKARTQVAGMLKQLEAPVIAIFLKSNTEKIGSQLPGFRAAVARCNTLVTRVGTYKQLSSTNPQVKKAMQDALLAISAYKKTAETGVSEAESLEKEIKPVEEYHERLENAMK